jgi:hypothetical protein
MTVPSRKAITALTIHNDLTFVLFATNQCAADEAESLRINHYHLNRVDSIGYNSSFEVSHLVSIVRALSVLSGTV